MWRAKHSAVHLQVKNIQTCSRDWLCGLKCSSQPGPIHFNCQNEGRLADRLFGDVASVVLDTSVTHKGRAQSSFRRITVQPRVFVNFDSNGKPFATES